MRRLLLLPIRVYQYAVSPLMVSHCRYQPTCSQYAAEAITLHGGIKGLYYAIKRLLKCHPWGKGGYDPVPGTDLRPETPSACCSPVSQTTNPNPTKR